MTSPVAGNVFASSWLLFTQSHMLVLDYIYRMAVVVVVVRVEAKPRSAKPIARTIFCSVFVAFIHFSLASSEKYVYIEYATEYIAIRNHNRLMLYRTGSKRIFYLEAKRIIFFFTLYICVPLFFFSLKLPLVRRVCLFQYYFFHLFASSLHIYRCERRRASCVERRRTIKMAAMEIGANVARCSYVCQ